MVIVSTYLLKNQYTYNNLIYFILVITKIITKYIIFINFTT